jgi:hypothetical protein
MVGGAVGHLGEAVVRSRDHPVMLAARLTWLVGMGIGHVVGPAGRLPVSRMRGFWALG